MRPLKLKMSAFGPYAEVQELDFTDLGARAIFLIHGPTGAGKTTILDGICFALYGDTSGAERSGKSMRSHHSTIEQLTEVDFEFSLADKAYRVHRTPEQERLRKSGVGTTMQTSDAELYKIEEDELGNRNETLIISGWSKVTEEIEKLIGFKSSQFRQVIMLPQGQFRKLLMADSVERQNIMEKLFDTFIYKAIEDMLKQQSKDLKNAIKETTSKQDLIFKILECNDLEDVHNKILQSKENLKMLEQEIKQKSEAVEKAQQRLNSARENNEKLIQRDKALIELEKLLEKSEQYEAKKISLEKARRASKLIETEKTAIMRADDKKRLEAQLEKVAKDYEESQRSLELAEQAYNLELSKESQREEAKKNVINLEQYTQVVASLDDEKKKVEELRAKLSIVEGQKQSCQDNIKSLEKNIENQRSKVDNAKEKASKLSSLESNLKEAENIYKKKKQLDKLHTDLLIADAKYNKEFENYSNMEQKLSKLKEQYQILEEKWNKGQASILASSLIQDSPCPVCGSLEHPKPAAKEEGVPTEQQLKSLKEELEKIEDQRDKLKKQADDIKLHKQLMDNSIAQLEQDLGQSSNQDIEDIRQTLEEIAATLQSTKEVAVTLERDTLELSKLSDDLALQKQRLETIESDFASINSKYQSSLGAYNERLKSLPEDIRTIESLNNAKKSAKSHLDLLTGRFEDCQRKYQAAQKTMTESKITLERLKVSLEESAENHQNARVEFLDIMKKSGFETYKDYVEAKLEEEDIKNLETDIKDFDGNLKSSRDNYERLNAAAQGLKAENLEDIENHLREAQRQKEDIIKLENTINYTIDTYNKHLKDVQQLDKSIKEMEKQYQIIGHLSDVANGSNSLGLTFQRYVLGALLDDITVAATERLKVMSKGRYHLRRTLDRARKNAAGGLELEVFDTYTGIERPVSTLSGGESFLASLSLALGLADVVQSYSGGINLDTIFVDEGFGTLDPESLDFAIKTLIDLQSKGRLVGIISHVPELKERIDARLEVMHGDKGSRARFVIA